MHRILNKTNVNGFKFLINKLITIYNTGCHDSPDVEIKSLIPNLKLYPDKFI